MNICNFMAKPFVFSACILFMVSEISIGKYRKTYDVQNYCSTLFIISKMRASKLHN